MVDTMLIRVRTADAEEMRTTLKTILLEKEPYLKDLNLSDKFMFGRLVKHALGDD